MLKNMLPCAVPEKNIMMDFGKGTSVERENTKIQSRFPKGKETAFLTHIQKDNIPFLNGDGAPLNFPLGRAVQNQTNFHIGIKFIIGIGSSAQRARIAQGFYDAFSAGKKWEADKMYNVSMS